MCSCEGRLSSSDLGPSKKTIVLKAAMEYQRVNACEFCSMGVWDPLGSTSPGLAAEVRLLVSQQLRGIWDVQG
jgi:hypothetical protein